MDRARTCNSPTAKEVHTEMARTRRAVEKVAFMVTEDLWKEAQSFGDSNKEGRSVFALRLAVVSAVKDTPA